MKTQTFYKKMFNIVAEKKLWLTILGTTQYPIWFIRNFDNDRHYPRLLIASGFHGEERAGPLAILQWLEIFDPNLYRKVNLSFIPLVNPVGFNNGKRYNEKNEKTNCGFCHQERGDRPSQEGIILLKNSQLLRGASKHGFLSLHEDIDSSKYYLYTFEREDQPTTWTLGLRDVLGSFFQEPLHEETVTTDAQSDKGVWVENGIVYKLCDGSCEDWLFHEGAIKTMASETPGKFPLKQRIEANVAIMNKFIELCPSIRNDKTS